MDNSWIFERIKVNAKKIKKRNAILLKQNDKIESINFLDFYHRVLELSENLSNFFHGSKNNHVAVIAHRTIQTVINIFGVIISGNTYIPLDPDAPKMRTDEIKKEADVSLVLDNEDLYTLNSFDKNDLDDKKCENAYILFTSGTTKKPKGIIIRHSGLEWLLHALRKEINYENNIIGINGPFTFDTTVKQLFQIVFGNTVALVPREVKDDVNVYHDYIHHLDINIIDLTPTQWAIYRFHSGPLLHILLGGENISQQLWNEIINLETTSKFYNLYGPTEVTVDATICPITKEVPKVSIGYPLDRVKVKLVKDEILISSPGLFAGYLNNPQLTQSKIVEENGAKWYKTGDKGKLTQLGECELLEFLGRIDRQVKIRGYRIELDEIEIEASKIEGLEHPIAIVEKINNFDKLLLYYCSNKKDLDSESIKIQLSKKLENYKLPDYVIKLNEVNVTKNGKLLKSSLPIPKPNLHKTLHRKLTNKEQLLVRAFTKVLGIQVCSPKEHFFELGGDSLSAMMLLVELKKNGLECSIRDIYETKNIEMLAKKLSQHKKKDLCKPKKYQNNHIPLLPIHFRFFQSIKTEMNHWNQSLMLDLDIDLDITKFYTAVNKVLQHHEIFTMIAEKKNDSYELKLNTNKTFSLNNIIFLYDTSAIPAGMANDTYLNKIVEEHQKKIDISNGSCIQIIYFTSEKRLFITFHHLYVDGVSLRIFADNLFNVYLYDEELIKTATYQDWCWTIQKLAKTIDISSLYNRYYEHVKDSIHLYEQFSGPYKDEHYEVAKFEIDVESTNLIKKLISSKIKVGFNSFLLTAFSNAIALFLNKEGEICVDMESQGRDSTIPIDVSNTIGWFTAIYPVVLNCKKNSKIEFILMMKAAFELLKNQEIKFGIAKYQQNDPRLQSIRPKIKFNYLGEFFSREGVFRYHRQNNNCDISPKSENNYAIEVEGYIFNKKLCFDIKYQSELTEKKQITDLSNKFKQAIYNYKNILVEFENPIENAYYTLPIQKIFFKTDVVGAYCEQFLFEITGSFDFSRFKLIWESVIEKYEALRSSFLIYNNFNSIQIVLKNPKIDWIFPKETDLQKIIRKDRELDFAIGDINCIPMRFYYLNNESNKHIFLWSHHHAILDGRSYYLLVTEIFNQYYTKSKLDYEVLPYGEYIHDVLNRKYDTNFFYNMLNNVKNQTLGHSKKHKCHSKVTHTEKWIEPDPSLILKLKAYSKINNVTLNHVMQLIVTFCLSSFMKKPKINLGVVISARDKMTSSVDSGNYQFLIGNTLNILPIILDIGNFSDFDQALTNNSIEQILKHIFETNIKLQENVHIPIQTIAEKLNLNMDNFYDVVLFYDNVKGENQFEKVLKGEGHKIQTTDYSIEESPTESSGATEIYCPNSLVNSTQKITSNIAESRKIGAAGIAKVQLKEFEQVHYPLTIIINDKKVFRIGIEYSLEYLQDNHIDLLFENILEMMRVLVKKHK
jgi:non-ribosomal peptide synthase protein (TIGR01720 family)